MGMVRAGNVAEVAQMAEHMLNAGASEQEVDLLLSDNGLTRQNLLEARQSAQQAPQAATPPGQAQGAPAPPQGAPGASPQAATAEGWEDPSMLGYAGDMLASGATGAVRGVVTGIPGMAGDIESLGRHIGETYLGYEGAKAGQVLPTSTDVENAYEDTADDIMKGLGYGEDQGFEFYDPKTSAGQVAGAVGAGAIMGGGAGIAKGLATAGRTAAMGAGSGAGSVMGAKAAEMVGGDPVIGGLAGGMATPWAAGKTIRSMGPAKGSVDLQAKAKILEKAGVKSLTASQARGSKGFARKEGMSSREGLDALDDVMAQGQKEFNSALVKNAHKAKSAPVQSLLDDVDGLETPSAKVNHVQEGVSNLIDAAFTRQMYIKARMSDATALQSAFAKFAGRQAKTNVKVPDELTGFARRVLYNTRSKNGLAGENISRYRNSFMQKIRTTKDQDIKDLYSDAVKIIDDMGERSMKGNDLATLRDARQAYKKMLILEDSLGGAGTKGANFDPNAVITSARTVLGKKKLGASKNDPLIELAEAYRDVTKIKPKESTGTIPSFGNRVMSGAGQGAILDAASGGLTMGTGMVGGAMLGGLSSVARGMMRLKGAASKSGQGLAKGGLNIRHLGRMDDARVNALTKGSTKLPGFAENALFAVPSAARESPSAVGTESRQGWGLRGRVEPDFSQQNLPPKRRGTKR